MHIFWCLEHTVCNFTVYLIETVKTRKIHDMKSWYRNIINYNVLYVEKYVDTGRSYVVIKHVVPWAIMCCFNSLHSISFICFTRCLNLAAGICSHSATRAWVKSSTDGGWYRLALSRHSSSSQRCWMGLRWGLCTGQSCSKLENHLFFTS